MKRVSVTQLREYELCPKRQQVPYAQRAKTLEQIVGTLCHEAIHLRLKGRYSAEESIRHIVDKWPTRHTDDSDEYFRATLWKMERLLTSDRLEHGRYVTSESTFVLQRWLESGEPYLLSGRIDALQHSPNQLTDWKCGASQFIPHETELRSSIATIAYSKFALLRLRTYHIRVTFEWPLNIREANAVSFTMEDEDIEQGLLGIDALATRYFYDVLRAPRENRFCNSCIVNTTCPVWVEKRGQAS